MSNTIEINTCKFVSLSQVFQNLKSALELFCEGDPNCSWGDCERSLISQELLTEEMLPYAEEDELGEVKEEVLTVLKRIMTLPEDVLIDLES